jgi:hypothetical protein
MTAATRPEVVEMVRHEWSISPWISTRQIGKRFQAKYGRNLIRDRKIAAIITEAKKEAPSEPFPLEAWQPWVNEEETPEDTLFLLQMNAIKRTEQGQGLYRHEAKWGRRIRAAIAGLTPAYRQYRLVTLYGEREVSAYYLNKPVPNTQGLDAFIAYQPWLVEHQHRYELALAQGLAPLPFDTPLEESRAAVVGRLTATSMEIQTALSPTIPPTAPDRDGLNKLVELMDEHAKLMTPSDPELLNHLSASPKRFPGWSLHLLAYLDPSEYVMESVTEPQRESIKAWSAPAKETQEPQEKEG